MTNLNPKHHTLIQTLLTRGPLLENEFHLIFKAVTGKSPGTHQQLFDDYLLKINKALSYVQFELRCCRHQYDGHVYYGVVNNISDEQSKLGTKYSVPQIAFYKAILDAILQDPAAQGSISNIAALNLRLENQRRSTCPFGKDLWCEDIDEVENERKLAWFLDMLISSGAVVLTVTNSESQGGDIPALRNFTITQKEKTLEELVQDQWLSSTPGGIVGLGIRSFLDLRSWFRSNDVPPCEICNEAGVKAELCKNESCTVRIHDYCLKKMFSQHKSGRVCPSCSTQWPFKGPKAEAVEEDEEPNVTTQSQLPSERKRKRIDSSSSQASQPISDVKRVARRSAQAR